MNTVIPGGEVKYLFNSWGGDYSNKYGKLIRLKSHVNITIFSHIKGT